MSVKDYFNLLPDNNNNHKQEVVRQIQQKRKHLGSLRMRPGLKLWKFVDGVLSEVDDSDYIEIEVGVEKADGKTIVHRKKLRTDPNTTYVTAINKKNAARKLAEHFKKSK